MTKRLALICSCVVLELGFASETLAQNSLWPAAATPETPDHGADSAVELGVRFVSDVSGYVEGIRFYKGAGNTGVHVGNLWTSTGTLLASATFTAETATGWQQVNFATPVPITAGIAYVASYHTDVGHYAADIGYFASSGIDNAPLHAPVDGKMGGNGTYMYGATRSFPGNTYSSTNYWVDVVFSRPPLSAITVSTTTPTVPTGATAQFTATATYADGSTQDITSQVTWTSTQPGVAILSSTGLATGQRAGAAGITATQGSVTGSTTLTVQAAALAVTTGVLPNGAQGSEYAAQLAAIGGTPPYSWSFASGALPPGLSLSAQGGISGVPWASGEASFTALVTDAGGATAMQSLSVGILTPGISVWPVSAMPGTPDHGPDSAVELGVRFVSDVNGYVEGIRFYKGAGNTGVHVGNLWTSTGTLLASAPFAAESATGWQQVDFATPVPITAGTVYVASYHTNVGHYAADVGFFASSGIDNAPLHAPADGTMGGNGAYMYGATSSFPGNTYISTNYWVDVVFSPPPLAAITVSTATPSVPTGAMAKFTATATYADGSTQDITGQVSWTSLNPAVANVSNSGVATSLTAGTTSIAATQGIVTGATTLTVQAAALAVTTAMLPNGSQGTAYTAQLGAIGGSPPYSWSLSPGGLPAGLNLSARGSISGVPWASGEASFTVLVTDAGGATATQSLSIGILAPGISLWSAAATPGTPDHGADSAVELGVRFVSDVSGYLEAIRFYKGAGNTGVHVGNLWTSTGTLLASATFTAETATGWQQVNFATPVPITAGMAYVASYHTDVGHYAADIGYFTVGVDNAPLHAPADGVVGGNGAYMYGATSSFPGNTYISTNYWVDVVFSRPPLSAITVSTATPTGPTGATAQFTATATYADGSTQDITSQVTWTSNQVRVATISSTGLATGLAAGTTKITAAQGAVTGSTTLTVQAATLAVTTGVLPSVAQGSEYAAQLAAIGGTPPYSWSFASGALPPGLSLSAQGGISGVPWASGETSFTVLVMDAGGATATQSVSVGILAPGISLWPAAATPGTPDHGPDSAVELGVRFVSDVNGYVEGIRFYKGAGNTGVHVGNLWTSTGTLLASVTFTAETATGWQQVNFATPVPIAAGTAYIASYHTNVGHYAADIGFFTGGADNAPLHAPADGVMGGNGAYAYGATSSFPGNTYSSTNYWVDVVFSPPPLAAITVSTATPSVPTGATARFAATATYADGSTQDITSQVSWTSSNLAVADVGTFGAATSMGPGTTDIIATQGSVSGSTTLTVNSTSLAVVTATLPVGVQGNTYTALLQAIGGLPPYSWSVASPSLPAGLTVSANGAISGIPTSAGVVTVAINVIDSAGNTTTQQLSISIVAPGISIWSSTATPSNPDHGADSPVEVGVRFVSDADGYIDGIRFYKGAGNTGVHVGNLWTAAGTLLASATFTGETGTGWQQVNFAAPVPITGGTAYIASYHTNVGDYAADVGFFAGSGVDNAPLHAPANGVGGANGVYAYNATSTFPASSYASTNYWVDVLFSPNPPSNPNPLQLAVVSPAFGAVVTATSADVTVSASSVAGIAWVGVNGLTLSIGADGLYRGTIPLSPGPNILVVSATDVTGNSSTVSVLVVSDSGGGVGSTGGSGSAGATIDATGGAVSLQGGPRIEVPPGALAAGATITITQEGPASQWSGPVSHFGPDGTSFITPATVHFPIPPGLTNPTIYWTTGGSNPQFQALATTVTGSTASAQISHFSWGYVALAPLLSISLATPTPNVPSGTTAQVTALGTFADGTTADITGQVDWSSSDPINIATISATGVLTAVGTGYATITATVGSVSGTLIIAVDVSCQGAAATPLTVALTYPSQGFTVSASSLAIQGSVAGGTPPFMLAINGVFTPTSPGGTFATMIGATVGAMTIAVQVTDSAGQATSAVVSGTGPAPGGGWGGISGGIDGSGGADGGGGSGSQSGASAEGPVRFTYDGAGNLTAVVDTGSDVHNCGALGNECGHVSAAAGTVACSQGICGAMRNSQFYAVWTDPLNCGPAAVTCAGPADSAPTCANGTCGFGCIPGYVISSNGSTCIDLQSDPRNCGYPNNVCQSGDTCSYGTCVGQGVPAPCSVNDVGIGGLAFEAPYWQGIRVSGTGLDSVTYVELEDWGWDGASGTTVDQSANETLPAFTGVVLTTQQIDPIWTTPIPFWGAPNSLVIPQAALQYVGNMENGDWGNSSFAHFWWNEWYKVRLHYLLNGIDSYVLVDVAISLNDQAPVTLPPPTIVGVSAVKTVQTGGGVYDPSTGFIRTYDKGNTIPGADPTTFTHPPTAVLAANDPLETEYPIFAITHEGVYVQAGLDPNRVQQKHGEFLEVALVIPYTDPRTERVDLRGGDPSWEWPVPPGGVILRGTNLVGDGALRIVGANGATLPGDLSAAVFLEQRIVIRSIYGVQDLTGTIEFDSAQGVAATPRPLAWLSTPVITGVGTLPYVVYDQVVNISGLFFSDVSVVAFSGGNESEFLTPAPASPPGPGQYFVVDDKNLQIMLSSNGGPVPRNLVVTCDGSEAFPGQRTFQIATAAGIAWAGLDAVNPSSTPPQSGGVNCGGWEAGGVVQHTLTPPSTPGGPTVPIPLIPPSGGCDLTNRVSATPCH